MQPYGPHYHPSPSHYMPPPPVPPHLGKGLDDEALTNLLMAWYNSGYLVGRYQVLRDQSNG